VLASALTLPLAAQDALVEAPSPSSIVNSAPQEQWVIIEPEDLLVMTLAPDSKGNDRKVVIQLMPAPFSQRWVENIRTLARTQWYDGVSVNRVQDNYVVQWGDPGHDNPESGNGETKPLPHGLNVMHESEYRTLLNREITPYFWFRDRRVSYDEFGQDEYIQLKPVADRANFFDPYSPVISFSKGFPIGTAFEPSKAPQIGWPIHCYGMIGVGRNYSPDTGSGAELYTVIGHAPRHLDRNIALVGRIISGMEHLSSLPRGSGALGFYTEQEKTLRTPILSIRVASDLPEDQQPMFEYLSTESASFAEYIKARANRRDPFFITPAGGVDICNAPVPVRPFKYTGDPSE